MDVSNTQAALNKFAEDVNRRAQDNLKRISDTGDLARTLKFIPSVHPNSFSVEFYWEDYGKFIDEGVRGAGGVRKTTSKYKRTNNKGKLWKIKAKGSRFKYRDIKPSVRHFEGWAKRKGLSPYAVREAVYHQGIEKTDFFSKPFKEEFDELPYEIIKAFALDVDDLLKFTLT